MRSIDWDLEILRTTRTNVLNLLETLSYVQVSKVPDGFSNSIMWNAVHSLTVQQLLMYRLSGLDLRVSNNFIDPFKKGATGSETLTEVEWDEFKKIYLESIQWLKEDHDNGIFKTFNQYTTSYNITLNNVEEVIAFNNTHEGLHYGSMLALRKFV